MIRPASRRRFLTGILLALGVALADQWSKCLILDWFFDHGQPMSVLPVFDLVFVQNHGVSFGILAAQDARWLLAGFTLIVMAFLLRWLWKTADRLTVCALGLIEGGAFGNLIDRIRLGAVTDFLDVHWQGHHWPAFNVADSAIVVGVGLLLLESAFSKERHPPAKR